MQLRGAMLAQVSFAKYCALHDQSMDFLNAELIADAYDRTIGNGWKSGDRFLNDFRINLVAAYIEPCLLAAAND